MKFMKEERKTLKVFCDTNVLMSNSAQIFNKYKDTNTKILISGYVLNELDKHKLSSDESKKYKARQASRDIEANQDMIEYVIRENNFEYTLPLSFDKDSMDNNIIAVLNNLYFSNEEFGKENGIEIIGLSNDLLFRQKCKLLGIRCDKFDGDDKSDDKYNGYKEVILSNIELAEHYQNPINRWDLLNNEYLIIRDENGNVVDKQKWNDKSFTFIPVKYKPFKSIYFPDFKPRDEYQILAMESLINNDLTLLFGKAGVAKTMISLSWIMQNIHTGKIGKCVIVFNPVKLRNNEQLGFYSGNRTEKLLQNSIGGILSSKFGDMNLVESLINNGKLMIIPTSDIRGIEISENDCLFVTEGQNTDAYTMRTIIQRAKEGCKIIIEGDMLEQQDLRNCRDNGMQRIIDVFKGTEYFSCVKLKNVYRSPIADIAQNI